MPESVLGVVLLLTLSACQIPAPIANPPTPAPTPAATAATAAPTPPLRVAVPVGSPTPTSELPGDVASLMASRLAALRADFTRLNQQLAAAQQAPMRMADDDWRNLTGSILEDLLVESGAIRTLTSRLAPGAPTGPATIKLVDDVDFVAHEFRMALDNDPDGTHFIRAARAEATTVQELDSIISQQR